MLPLLTGLSVVVVVVVVVVDAVVVGVLVWRLEDRMGGEKMGSLTTTYWTEEAEDGTFRPVVLPDPASSASSSSMSSGARVELVLLPSLPEPPSPSISLLL
jgi:hypothetical protein